jgi:hypothetical protein
MVFNAVSRFLHRGPTVHTVAFITVEDDGTDLIVSFALEKPSEPFEVESLTLLRTPKYEVLEDANERGVTISFDRFSDGIERDLLEEARYSEHNATVEFKTRSRGYRLDVRKVNPDEIADMRKVLLKMNYDGRFRLTGI